MYPKIRGPLCSCSVKHNPICFYVRGRDHAMQQYMSLHSHINIYPTIFLSFSPPSFSVSLSEYNLILKCKCFMSASLRGTFIFHRETVHHWSWHFFFINVPLIFELGFKLYLGGKSRTDMMRISLTFIIVLMTGKYVFLFFFDEYATCLATTSVLFDDEITLFSIVWSFKIRRKSCTQQTKKQTWKVHK